MTSLWVLLALACITFSLTPSMAWDREGIHLQEESMEDTPYQVDRFIFLVVTEEKENYFPKKKNYIYFLFKFVIDNQMSLGHL